MSALGYVPVRAVFGFSVTSGGRRSTTRPTDAPAYLPIIRALVNNMGTTQLTRTNSEEPNLDNRVRDNTIDTLYPVTRSL